METTSAAPVSAHQWQFSLKHLLVFLGAACVLLAPAHYFGGAYLFSIGCSLALVFFCSRASRRSASGAVFVSTAGLLFGFLLTMAVIPFGIHTFFNFVACTIMALVGARPRRLAAGLVLTMLAVYSLLFYSAIIEVRKLVASKAKTPFESLDAQLAFEIESTPAVSTSAQPIELTAAIAEKLNLQDQVYSQRYFRRAWALEQLHEHTATQFARVAGFGVARMPHVTPRSIELEPREPLTLPTKVTITPLNAQDAPLESLHESAIRSFIDPERMGYVRSRREVSGFESHGLSSLERDEYCAKRNPDWQIVRLELVSLLRNMGPRAYVAKTLPEMDQLANVPNRSLNTFEQSALPQLATQKNVVVNEQRDRIEMLGALRAGTTCLDCHHGERGSLLGAFSYELVSLKVADTSAALTGSAN